MPNEVISGYSKWLNPVVTAAHFPPTTAWLYQLFNVKKMTKD